MRDPTGLIYFRCDADSVAGMGHVSRCLALAEAAFGLGHQARFVMRGNHAEAQSLVRARGFDVEPLPGKCALEHEADYYPAEAKVVVLDLCHATIMRESSKLRALVEGLKHRGCGLVVIDSMEEHAFGLHCTPEPDVVVTPYLGAELQKRPACRRWLAGAGYAILSDGYDIPKRMRTQNTGEPTRVLVSMGGSDAFGLTDRALQTLQRVNDAPFACRVVIGPFFSEKYVRELRSKYGGEFQNPQLEWVQSAHGLIEQYYWADLVIGAAGLMRYEVGALGLASLLIAPRGCYRTYLEQFNKNGIARILFAEDAGFGERLLREAELLISSPLARASLGVRGPELINARGKDIVIATLLEACTPATGATG
jgi:spore coat polysaccharide biosynthesis predicted glycosyltransferase SpsG